MTILLPKLAQYGPTKVPWSCMRLKRGRLIQGAFLKLGNKNDDSAIRDRSLYSESASVHHATGTDETILVQHIRHWLLTGHSIRLSRKAHEEKVRFRSRSGELSG